LWHGDDERVPYCKFCSEGLKTSRTGHKVKQYVFKKQQNVFMAATKNVQH